jgi:outer membrane protein assembly factor BamE (lipoprotein component of BamABCDE complex)
MQKFFYSIVFLFLLSCASSPSDKIAYSKVESSIIRGRTTQNEVIQIMGSPNLVTKNSRGEEVWTYTQKTYNPQTGSVNGGVILSGGTRPATNGANTAAFDLILTFDQADIVRDYSVVSTEL